jgi:hypothetical protein
MRDYIPIEYPKWVGGVIVQNAAEEQALRSLAADPSSGSHIVSLEINRRSPPVPPPALAVVTSDKSPASVTIRMRRSRARRRAGKRTISFDIATDQIEALIRAGFLDPAMRDDAAAVALGVERLMDHMSRSGQDATEIVAAAR